MNEIRNGIYTTRWKYIFVLSIKGDAKVPIIYSPSSLSRLISVRWTLTICMCDRETMSRTLSEMSWAKVFFAASNQIESITFFVFFFCAFSRRRQLIVVRFFIIVHARFFCREPKISAIVVRSSMWKSNWLVSLPLALFKILFEVNFMVFHWEALRIFLSTIRGLMFVKQFHSETTLQGN